MLINGVTASGCGYVCSLEEVGKGAFVTRKAFEIPYRRLGGPVMVPYLSVCFGQLGGKSGQIELSSRSLLSCRWCHLSGAIGSAYCSKSRPNG